MIDRTRRRVQGPGGKDRPGDARATPRAGGRRAHPHAACCCGTRPCICESEDRELEAVVRELVESLVATLPPADAEVLRRAELLGQPAPTIARALGLDEAIVETRLREGRRRLLNLLALTLSGEQEKCG